MAQVTGAISGRISKVEYSTDYSTYTDYSGGANSISISGGERKSSEAFTFDGDTAIVTFGKLTPAEITFKSLYVDSSVGHFAVVSGMKTAATPMNVRWAYDTDTTGSWRFTSATGGITACTPPEAEASGGDPLLFEWTVRCPGWAEAVIA